VLSQVVTRTKDSSRKYAKSFKNLMSLGVNINTLIMKWTDWVVSATYYRPTRLREGEYLGFDRHQPASQLTNRFPWVAKPGLLSLKIIWTILNVFNHTYLETIQR